MQRICTSLAQHGFQVTLIGRNLPQSKAIPSFPFHTFRLNCIFNKGKLFYLEYNFRLFWKLLFTHADVYAAVDLDTITACFTAAWLKGKKKTFDAHEYFEEVPEVVNRPLTKAIWHLTGKFFVPHADLAITVSEGLAEKFQQLYGIRFNTIYNVPDYATVVQNQEGSYLLYQGALNTGRGLEQIIAAMKHVDLPLMIAGEGDLSCVLRERVHAAGLQQKITFLGLVPPEQLNSITARAWLGLNLLENKGLSYYHSLANKFFDYINYGVPSLNMDFPEYRKMHTQYETGVLLKELSPAAIVGAIQFLSNNPGHYAQLKKNCIAAKEQYNWQREERKLLNLYSRFA